MNPPKSPHEVLAAGRAFMESRILISAAELDVFTLLADTPLTCQEAASRAGLETRALAILLDALAALGYLVKKDGCYQTPEDLSPLLRSDSPTCITPMILHGGTLWHRWSNLTEIVRGSEKVKREPALFTDTAELKAFIGAMHVVGAPQAPRFAAAVGAGKASRLLDVGGGSGAYTIAFLSAFPQLKATLFDRPAVIEMAGERLKKQGLLDRVTLAPGDFYKDDLPAGHDLALLSAIIHQNSLKQNVALYRKVYNALDPGGRIVIRDHVMSADRIAPASGAVFAINMLVGTPGGGTYTYDEIKEGLIEAGFKGVNLISADEAPMSGLVEAFK